MIQLILIRHGQTQWNREGRWQGQADPPLNALGRRQARRAALDLRGARLDHLYSSDLRRALETAHIIGADLGLAVIPDPRLREINLGRWQGMLSADIEAQYPDEFRRWHDVAPDDAAAGRRGSSHAGGPRPGSNLRDRAAPPRTTARHRRTRAAHRGHAGPRAGRGSGATTGSDSRDGGLARGVLAGDVRALPYSTFSGVSK